MLHCPTQQNSPRSVKISQTKLYVFPWPKSGFNLWNDIHMYYCDQENIENRKLLKPFIYVPSVLLQLGQLWEKSWYEYNELSDFETKHNMSYLWRREHVVQVTIHNTCQNQDMLPPSQNTTLKSLTQQGVKASAYLTILKHIILFMSWRKNFWSPKW